MMNFLKDWIIQYQNKFLVGGTETTIERVTGTVSQEGDTINAAYLNEIQKNCIYQVNATRVIEGVLEIYDITIDGSEEFTPFNQTFLIDFDSTNTQTDSLLRFNGNTYSLRFSDSILNGDIAPKIGFIPKRALVKLDVSNSKAIIVDFNPNNFVSPAFTGTPTAPTPSGGDNSTKIATTQFSKETNIGGALVGGYSVGTTYTNTSNRPWVVYIGGTNNNSTSTVYINSTTVQYINLYGTSSGACFIVPPGATWNISANGWLVVGTYLTLK